MEIDQVHAARLDDWVQWRRDDLDALVAQRWYGSQMFYDEALVALLLWMRDHNRTAPRPVHVAGYNLKQPDLALSPSVVATPPTLVEQALTTTEALLDGGARQPAAVVAAMRVMRRAAREEAEAQTDLLHRLERQLEPLASPAVGAERRRSLVAEARSTLELIVAKRSQPAEPLGGQRQVAAFVPDNDDCANAIALPGLQSGSTVDATNDGSASCGGSSTAPDVWYTYTATEDGFIAWRTLDSLLDTVVSVHSACPDAGGADELTCNDDARGGLGSLVGHEMTRGETVWVRVSGAGGATGQFELETVLGPDLIATTAAAREERAGKGAAARAAG